MSEADGVFVEVVDPADARVRWRFDQRFLNSNWTCIWGRGCQGILDVPAEHLQQGCCSVGAQMADDDEAMTIAASAAAIPRHLWQFADVADERGLFREGSVRATALVDDACIFLNRPGFAGGAGCALHLAALDCGERPIDWKPTVCWQAPLRVVESTDEDAPGGVPGSVPDGVVVTVRPWTPADWGDGAAMAWCCTSAPEAMVGDRPVLESLDAELRELAGDAVIDALWG